MKLRTTAILVTSMLFGLSANAGPFGINMGEPIVAEGTAQDGTIYETANVENTGGFEQVVKFGVPRVGTCWVIASTYIMDSGAGRDAQRFFHDIKDIIIEKYGKPTAIKDSIEEDSLNQETWRWVKSIETGDRVLEYYWKLQPSRNSINRILLHIPSALSLFGVRIELQYDFDNVLQCVEARKQVF